MYHVLICDDEVDIVNALKIYLADPNYQLFAASNGQQALDILQKEEIQLVLLDVMMPVLDGVSTLLKIREQSNVPVIMLTAKSEDSDKILGLTMGADDYITKPFNPMEVVARVKSHLRRYMQLGGNIVPPSALQIGGIILDDRTKKVLLDDTEIALTPKEYDILKLLMQRQGEVLSPKEIYRNIWKEVAFGGENTIAVHIRHLREKLELNPAEPRYLKVVWGQGYKMEKG